MKAYCSICLDYHALSKLRILRLCGHTFCATTLDTLFRTKSHRGRIECPLCRKSIARADVLPIHLDFRDPDAPPSQAAVGEPTQEAYSTDVLTELAGLHASMEAISADSSADFIKRTAHRLQNALSDVETQDCAVTGLLHTIARAFERLAGGISTIASHRDEVLALRRQLKQEQRHVARVLEDNARVQRDLDEAGQIAQAAVDTADAARDRYTAAKAQIAELQRAAKEDRERHAREVAEKEGELARLKDMLMEHKAKATKHKAKITELKHQLEEREAALAVRTRPLTSSSSLLVTPVSARPVAGSSTVEARHRGKGKGKDPFRLRTPAPSEFDPTDMEAEDEDPACLPPLFPTPPDDDASSPLPAPPAKFSTDWNLSSLGKRKRITSSGQPVDFVAKKFPLKVDHRGRPQGLMQLGSRQRERFG